MQRPAEWSDEAKEEEVSPRSQHDGDGDRVDEHDKNEEMHKTDSFVKKHLAELEARKKSLGDTHPAVAEIYSILGLFHHHVISDHEMSLSYHLQALQILRTASLSDESCEVELAVTLTDVGNVCRSLGDDEGAMSSYQEALHIFAGCSPSVPESHPGVGAARRGMSMLSCGAIISKYK
mmetsp:Transcript_38619/g.78765  ORF Transcript_38619/g.78765 Transcript_38619/m.78765 type:complete len:178 (-) Transcript_38619:86-619(-)|eukprot:CAMPEP_0183317908 /NCGR_PEP_ID=MMETSP0160_2-20130417/59236_1 /TAXON_ID=2839 ORGANISM="Odontella Sinensis, Strain Grunow 1884" /NCGR_SAMPLE_ID=MMETSP0160_2 /ASSEMBLY_ACC=CAM_ASM_000250 /LENGTH=177 /DNA_ID=CAMNT_0025484045 /DNA_START=67 /DNA_END=600 /DNA_ORIENTATION=-